MSPARPDLLAPLTARGPSLPRRLADRAARAGCQLAAGVVVLPLALIVWHIVRLGGAATVLTLGTFLGILWRREWRKGRRAAGAT